MEKDKNGFLIIEINGDKYVRKQVKHFNPTLRKMKSIAIMAGIFGVTTNVKNSNVKSVTENKNVIEEFRLLDAFQKGLIKTKSKLSKRERDLIVYEFNKNFEKYNG